MCPRDSYEPGREGDEARLSALLAAVAAPKRMRMIARLRESPCSVGELAAHVGMEQSAVSHHLQVLRELGLVVSRRRGRQIIYALDRNRLRLVFWDALGSVERPASDPVKRLIANAGQEGTSDVARERLTTTYIIAEPCIDVKDRSCVDVCPVDCIHEADRMLVIDPEECIDCGACESECPVEAIYPEDALPDKWEPFVRINYAYSEGLAAVNDLVAQRIAATPPPPIPGHRE